MGGGDDGAAKREAANVEAMEALENVNSPTTPHGTPLLERLVQLEQQAKLTLSLCLHFCFSSWSM